MRERIRRGVERLLGALRPSRGSSHLTDRELVRMLVKADGGNPTAAGDAHLRDCLRCGARVRTLQAGLDRVSAAAEAAFGDAVPAWRLVQQRRRIMRRIQRAAGGQVPARILRFPAAPVPSVTGPHANRRWLSLTAAVGLLLAVVIGQVIDGRRQPAASPRSAAAAPSQPIIGPPAAPPQAVADELFMRELEEALTSSRVTPLLALDEMTPRVRAAGIDIR